MKRVFSHFAAAGIGACCVAAFNGLSPVTKNDMHLKGILGFAQTLEGYGLKPEFDPRTCEIFDAPPAERRDLGSHLVFACQISTPKGTFYSDKGYDRAGRVVDGGQGFEEEAG